MDDEKAVERLAMPKVVDGGWSSLFRPTKRVLGR